MLRNYLKIAYRSLRRHKGYTIINVVGLAVGMACSLLILLYVQDELSYDRFHAGVDRIYRVIQEKHDVTPTIVAPLFKRTFPEVEQAARVYDVGAFRPVVARHGDISYLETNFVYADSTVFDVFTLPLVVGNPEVALTRPGTIVLSQSAACRYFGDEDPLGKTLTIGTDRDFEITGVMEDVPRTSHFQIHFMASFSTLGWSEEEIWDTANFSTYLLLREEDVAEELQKKISSLLDDVRAQQPGGIPNDYRLLLQPLTRIHLQTDGRVTYVSLFSAIAFLLLLIACINYVNLATARSARRAREVGVRKVFGADRIQLISQFYAESAVVAIMSLLLVTILVMLLLPIFNGISGKEMVFNPLAQPILLLGLVGMGLFVATLAGSYPALVLSSFKPVSVLKATRGKREGGRFIRHGLVVFQFAASIILIAATCVVYLQLSYVRSQNLGFDEEQIVVLPLTDYQLRKDYRPLKEVLLEHPRVLNASAVNSIPGYQRGGYALIAEGLSLPEGEHFPIRGIPADADVVETLGFELIAGQGFPGSPSYEPESGKYVYLINEATARALGWTTDDAVGRRIGVSGRMGEVVGVIGDYHYASLHEPIEPLALFIEEPEAYEYLMVKIAPVDVSSTLDFLEHVWKVRAPSRPFHYTFLDQEFDALYRSEERAGQIFGAFATLAVLIACLGLFGLAAFAAEQRTKEIGIRKVLGASIAGVLTLLSTDFLRPVAIAFVLSAPVGYFLMQRWLEGFAYRIELSWWIFAVAGATALVIALLTVSYQTLRAALANPTDSLRYE